MELSISTNYNANTNYDGSNDDPAEAIRFIAEAGFTRIHWGHRWTVTHLYQKEEIRRIRKLLAEFNLKLQDLHASDGGQSQWCSMDEEARLMGENLLLNRIRMTSELGGRAIVLHPNSAPFSDETKKMTEQGVKTLVNLHAPCRELGIRIAIENLFNNEGETCFYDIRHYFDEFSADYIGFCWDSGHSNIVEGGVEKILDFASERLIVLHLHGNDGVRDDHLPIGEGNVDWEKSATIVAGSSYSGALTQEIHMPVGEQSLDFLCKALKRGKEFAAKIEAIRKFPLVG